jgi:hypothetical protein
MLTKKVTDHIVAKVSGVKASDSKIEAANKAIAVMRAAGFPAKDIRAAERMRDAAIARGVK